MMNNDSPDDSEDLHKIFMRALEKETNKFKGKFWDIIRRSPEFFNLFINLATDPEVPPEGKHIINATITYFVVPHDILSEKMYGAIGYLDDLYLCTWALKELEKKVDFKVIEKHWKGEGDLKTVIEEVHEKTFKRVEDLEDDILEFVGLE